MWDRRLPTYSVDRDRISRFPFLRVWKDHGWAGSSLAASTLKYLGAAGQAAKAEGASSSLLSIVERADTQGQRDNKTALASEDVLTGKIFAAVDALRELPAEVD